MDRRIALLVLILLTAWAYRPLATAGFVYEDNNPQTALDPRLPNDDRGPWEGWRAELARVQPLPRALTNLTMRAQGWAHADARGYHLGNLTIHVINGLLFDALAVPVVGANAALIATSLWLLHPIASEAVSYVSARTDLLYATFVLLMLLCAEREWRIGVFVAGVCAVLAKETAVTVIGFLPLYLWVRGRWSARWVPVLGAWGLGALPVAYRLIHVSAHQGAAHPWGAIWAYTSMPQYGWLEVGGLQLAALGRLLALVIWPRGFSIDHDFDVMPAHVVALATCFALGVVWIAWRARHTHPLITLALGWLLIGLAPRLIVPLPEYLHEQHLYVLLIGPWLALSVGLVRFADYCIAQARLTRRLWTQGLTT